MAKERCSMFHGREDILEDITEYLCGDSDEPLTVYGPSGSGKTSILAEAARQVPFTYNKEAIVVLRFLGTSPDSSNLWRLLRSLSGQILKNIEGDLDKIPDDFNDLLVFFQSLIEKYHEKSRKPLVILLDSLDQLSSDFGAQKLRWLPKKVPKNVRIVTSTYTESNDIINSLKALFMPKSFILVKILGEDLSVKILKTWLQSRSRTLTNEQFDVVQEAFKKCSLPLYVKLVFEEVLTWRSHTQVTMDTLAYTVQESINTLLQRLETKHGKVFVNRTLAYITASQSGISEAEMEDVLSLDDILLTDVFQYHVPPFRRVPPVLWVRVRHDISSYLVDKEVDDTRVFFWYHRQFYEAAEKRYLFDGEFSKEIHSLLADYYIGVWHEKPKPFKYSMSQMKKLGLSSPDSEADRKVADQPIRFEFTSEDGQIHKRFNLRKLNKLPFHLINADRIGEARSMCLYNYDWLLAKLMATSVQQVLSDFIMSRPDKDSLLQRIIKTAQSTLRKFPDTLAMEISGHLLPLLSEAKNSLEKLLVEQCLEKISRGNNAIPYQTCYRTPNEALLFKFEHLDLPYGSSLVAISSDSLHLIALTDQNVLISWDLLTGELERQVLLLDPAVIKLNIMTTFPKQNIAAFGSSYQKQQNCVVIVNMTTSDIVNSVVLEKNYPGVGFTDSLKFVVTESKIICLHVGHTADLFERETGKQIAHFDVLPSDDMVTIQDGEKVIFHVKQSNSYKLFDLSQGDMLGEFSVSKEPMKIVPEPSGLEAVVIFKNSPVFNVISLGKDEKPGKLIEESKISNPETDSVVITDVKFSLDNENLILTTNEGFVVQHYKKSKEKHTFSIPNHVKPEHKVLTYTGHMTPDKKYFVAVYEGHLIVWNATTGRLLKAIEASRSKTVVALLSTNGELLVTSNKRNNFITVWKISSLVLQRTYYEPLTIKTAPRYMAVSENGNMGVTRGNISNEVATLDIHKGCIGLYISKDYEVMQPSITPNGEYVILREYESENVLKIWNSRNGELQSSVPLSSLLVKHYTLADNKMAVYVHNDITGDGELSFWTIPDAHHIHTQKLGKAAVGDMFMFFDSTSENIIVSGYSDEGVNITNLFVYNIRTGEKKLTFPRVVSTCTQHLVKGKDLVLLQQRDENSESNSLIVLDIKSGKILRKGKDYSSHRLALSGDGHYGIDKSRLLYNLEKMIVEYQFDADGDYPKNPTTQTCPKITTDGTRAVWLNINAGLLLVGDIQTGKTVSVCPIHSNPFCLELTCHDHLLVGCEDGRLMIMQLTDSKMKDDVYSFISGFLSRHKNQSQRAKVVKYTGRRKPEGQKTSKTCNVL